MKNFHCSLLIILLIVILSLSAHSNNIQVSSATLTQQDIVTKKTTVQFTLSWDNSWLDIVNRDAAWVFVKYKRSDGIWRHATLSGAIGDYTIPPGCGISLSASYNGILDSTGVYVYRNTGGSGSVNFSNVGLRWMYGLNGVGDNEFVTVKVFAIEMVHIPEGNFSVGDGATSVGNGEFYTLGSGSPFQISSEGAIPLGGINIGNLHSLSLPGQEDYNVDTQQTLPATFPKGYYFFYMMKYELSQKQWVEFFNTLTTAQKANRDLTDGTGKNSDGVSFRNSISWISGDATTGTPAKDDRACSYLSWSDAKAYADWAALRPMTELEYEKACRGAGGPLVGEYAWGTTSITSATHISGSEDGTETITNAGANCSYNYALALTNYVGGDGGAGPLRCGIFATATSTREQAGASFYGVMDLSGNLSEYAVGVGSTSQRDFGRVNGDGALTSNGNADVVGWSFTVTGVRGGSWTHSSVYATVSNRLVANGVSDARGTTYGFRAVRTGF